MTTKEDIVEDWLFNNKGCRKKFLDWLDGEVAEEKMTGKEYWKSWRKEFEEAWGV